MVSRKSMLTYSISVKVRSPIELVRVFYCEATITSALPMPSTAMVFLESPPTLDGHPRLDPTPLSLIEMSLILVDVC